MKNLKLFLILLAFLGLNMSNAWAEDWSGTKNLTDGQTITQNITLTGNVTINVASGTATISGVISGGSVGFPPTPATLTKTGAGTLVFTGNNTYLGTTTVSAGTLTVGNGGSNGKLGEDAITVATNGTLRFNRSGSYTINKSVFGAGKVIKEGTGTVSTTGYYNVLGTTTINAGTFSIDNGSDDFMGGSIGSISIGINGTLRISGTITAKVSGVISGTGKIYIMDQGCLLLTGNNTFTGSTTVNSGTLDISTGGDFAGDVLVESNGKLEFSSSNDYTFSKVISGTGQVTKSRSGKLNLYGVNTYTGLTTISNGTLAVGGNSIKSDILVSGAGELELIPPLTPNSTSTYGGIISGTGNVTIMYEVQGSDLPYRGTLTLTGNHTATGTLTCKGALNLSGNWKGNFVKSSTLTVTGNRTIGGTFTTAGGTIRMDLGATSPSRLSITGVLHASGTNTINITGTGTASSYILISAASGVSTSPFTVTGATGTLTATSTELMFTPTTGVSDITNDKLVVYPNPTNGELRIENGENKGINPLVVEIFDIYGRKVATKFSSNELEGWQPQADGVVFNISHFPAGIYFVKIHTENGMVTKRVVKQ